MAATADSIRYTVTLQPESPNFGATTTHQYLICLAVSAMERIEKRL